MVVRKQLEAAGMNAGQHCQRQAGINRGDVFQGEIQREVDLALRNHRLALGVRGDFDIADVGETLIAQ